ncbi:hypothetical protein D3C78_1684590 [compost metagenome]
MVELWTFSGNAWPALVSIPTATPRATLAASSANSPGNAVLSVPINVSFTPIATAVSQSSRCNENVWLGLRVLV